MKDLSFPVSDMAPFRTPSVLNGEAPLLSLGTENTQIVGKIWAKDGVISFEGNADESAKVFFGVLKPLLSDEIAGLQSELSAARRDAESWYEQAQARTADAVQFAAERDALAAKLAELEGQTDNLLSTCHRLALELECLLLDTKDSAPISRWWDSAMAALDEWHKVKDSVSARPVLAQPVNARLLGAIKRLSFCAQTTGGTAGRDEELCAAIGEAEKAIAAANPATVLTLISQLRAVGDRAMHLERRLSDANGEVLRLQGADQHALKLQAGHDEAAMRAQALEKERDALAAKLKELERQEPVAWVDVKDSYEGPYNFEGMKLLAIGKHHLFARPVPAKPVNARLLAIATGQLQHIYSENCPDPLRGPNSRDPECPACRAIIAAESAPKAPQVDLEAIARAIWNVRREEEDRCDMELEDMGRDHSVWDEASDVASILKDAGIEVAE